MITIMLCSIFVALIVGILAIVDELRQIKALLSEIPPATPGGDDAKR